MVIRPKSKKVTLANLLLLLGVIVVFTGCLENRYIKINFPKNMERQWLGVDLFAEHFNNWKIDEGKINCTIAPKSMERAFILTHELSKVPTFARFVCKIEFDTLSEVSNDSIVAGFEMGIGSCDTSYKQRIVETSVHQIQGLFAGITRSGKLVFYENRKGFIEPESAIYTDKQLIKTNNLVKLFIEFIPIGNNYHIYLRAVDRRGFVAAEKMIQNWPGYLLDGSVSLTAINHTSANKSHGIRFFDIKLGGEKLKHFPERSFGPVYGVVNYQQNDSMHILAQFAPISDSLDKTWLEIRHSGSKVWKKVAQTLINPVTWQAKFTFAYAPDSTIWEYRIGYKLPENLLDISNYYRDTIANNQEPVPGKLLKKPFFISREAVLRSGNPLLPLSVTREVLQKQLKDRFLYMFYYGRALRNPEPYRVVSEIK